MRNVRQALRVRGRARHARHQARRQQTVQVRGMPETIQSQNRSASAHVPTSGRQAAPVRGVRQELRASGSQGKTRADARSTCRRRRRKREP